MSDVVVYTFSGRLTKDPETREYGSDGNKLTTINVASTIGFGDNAKTVYHNCTAFKKTAEAIAKHFKKGDQIIINGTPTQNKKDDKVYYGVNISDWSFGAKKDSSKGSSKDSGGEENPFDDSSIPF